MRTHAMMVGAARETAAGATHEEARSEGDKDTRATEQSYIARGQAMRAEQIGEDLARLEGASWDDRVAVQPPSLVRLASEDDEVRVYLVAAFGAGIALELAGAKITVVTPASPVGAALSGRGEGDDVELPGKGGPKSWTLEKVR